MKHNCAKKIAGGCFALAMTFALAQPMLADDLNTEMASAGAAVDIENYISSTGSEDGLSSYLPAPEKTENKTTKVESKKTTNENKLFSNIAIAKVEGGSEGYVNVRRRPSAKGKRVGKIYNNCGATIIEETSNGWYKIKSGNCTGYIKAEFFVTGNKAQSRALDNGYVFANVTATGVHVREKSSTKSDIVTNVYRNEDYSIRKYSADGKWVKIKIADGVSGWVSADFVKVSVDMDTAVTMKEEKAIKKAQRQKEKAARKAAQAAAKAKAKAQAQQRASEEEEIGEAQPRQNTNTNSNSNTYTAPKTTRQQTTQAQQNNDTQTSSGGASAVVAYAKQFLGNPYVYGGSSLTNGTDCSGFTMSVYAHFGYSLNRSSYTQVYNGRAVSLGSLQPGDLLFYKYNSSTISHVAMYIGGGQIIHASTEETGIIISGMGSPCAARRIIN